MIILIFTVFWVLSTRLLRPSLLTTRQILEYMSEDGLYDRSWHERLESREFAVDSPYGYNIYCIHYPADSKKFIILSHGISVNRHSVLKFTGMYIDRGWNVLIYDHRCHGRTGGRNTSYGYYEKDDLASVVNRLKDEMGEYITIGIHGESMGAAIALMYGGKYNRADFYISDCAYSNLWDELSLRLRRDYHMPVFPVMQIADILVRLRAGFGIRQVSPVDSVQRIDAPVLFIHGENDNYVPAHMAEKLFSAKTKGSRGKYMVPGASHADSYAVNPSKYERVVFEFIENHIAQKCSLH